MSDEKQKLIKVWKDPQYRAQLTPDELAALPQHPAGVAEIDRALLAQITGGAQMPSQGWICTVSAECGGKCCVSINWPW
jgi:mersacidin/lichenicidin family type 2 lantibiotic